MVLTSGDEVALEDTPQWLAAGAGVRHGSRKWLKASSGHRSRPGEEGLAGGSVAASGRRATAGPALPVGVSVAESVQLLARSPEHASVSVNVNARVEVVRVTE